ncbi:MAG TPA: DNA oxidative demethylase AlkB [Capsulimonadaceae bacterium]
MGNNIDMHLFSDDEAVEPARIELAEGAVLFRGRALAYEGEILAQLASIEAQSPFRHMVTRGGHEISAAMTSCGRMGWVSDRNGYRYEAIDPLTGKPWPPMPASFTKLAVEAASDAGFEGFAPDACLINCYVPGAKMGLHQDSDERFTKAPIVSVSLGVTATFQFGGVSRVDSVRRYALRHGDVVVWGGPSRMAYHGIMPVPPDEHPLVGRRRVNLTFRRAR